MLLPKLTIGLDLAQANDYTALIALAHHEVLDGTLPTAYGAVMIERWRDRPYTDVPRLVDRAQAALHRVAADQLLTQTGHGWPLSSAADITLVVDATGVGAGVVDMLADAGLQPVRIVITGGVAVNRLDRGGYSVPKSDLVATVQLLLESRRLRIADDLPHAETLARELQNFTYDITASGRTRFGAGGDALAWRGDGAHDDLLLALAIAAWHAEKAQGARLDSSIVAAFSGLPT